MDSQVVQDLLPGTGSLGSVPMQHVRRVTNRLIPVLSRLVYSELQTHCNQDPAKTLHRGNASMSQVWYVVPSSSLISPSSMQRQRILLRHAYQPGRARCPRRSFGHHIDQVGVNVVVVRFWVWNHLNCLRPIRDLASVGGLSVVSGSAGKRV